MNYSTDLISVPYKELREEEITDYKLLETYIDYLKHPDAIPNTKTMFESQPSIGDNDFRDNWSSNTHYDLFRHTDGVRSKYIDIQSFPYELTTSLLDNIDTEDYYYKYSYAHFLDTTVLPVITSINEKEKLRQFYIELFNQLFAPLEKNFSNDVLNVKLDKQIKDYEYFANNRFYYKEKHQNNEEHTDLYNWIGEYFRRAEHFNDYNAAPQNIFDHTTLLDGVKFDEETNILTISLDLERDLKDSSTEGVKSYYYRIWFFYGKLLNFLVVTELISIYRTLIPVSFAQEKKETFLAFIKNRRVPIEDVNHKAGLKYAEKLGLTHFFLPIDEENIPNYLSFSAKLELKNHSKIQNIWNIIPPTEGYNTTMEYLGHNNRYSELTTIKEPHLLGMPVVQGVPNIKARFDKDFYRYLIENYEWDHREEAIETFKVIDKYPMMFNRLEKIAKEINEDD